MKNNMLYDLEYKVNELRKDYEDRVIYNDLTLKDVLDLGFNRTYLFINEQYVYFYKDLDNNYLLEDNYFTDEKILNEKVSFVCSEIDDYNYLEITITFKDEEGLKLLNQYIGAKL